jgi:hypothetical protein
MNWLISLVAPKKKAKKDGTVQTPTYNAQQSQNVLTIPQYRDHLTDIYTSRQANDSRALMAELFRHDPDVSATVNSYLTLANTQIVVLARDLDGNIDREATKGLHTALDLLTRPTDYTLGFQLKRSLDAITAEMRYMLLLRGSIGVEVVLNEKLEPKELRQLDMATVEWYEKRPGEYKPIQKPVGSNVEINLDLPTFFVAFFRRSPLSIYTHSFFVSAINTIAARQQVINDLYRIMQITGFPRMSVAVVEEVLQKNAPPAIKNDQEKLREWVNARFNEIRNTVTNLRPDEVLVHVDAVEPKILNDQKPGATLNISEVIETLNGQNQAGLKTMATVIGRGQQGVNTASVEARIAAMNADELNYPIAEILQNVCSFLLHSQGYQGFAEVYFERVELRPDLELEPQRTLLATRLRQDLSDGLITDDEYHLWLYQRIRPDSAPELSGTKFMMEPKIAVDAERISPNSDPMGRSLAPEGGRMAQSDAN